MRIDEVTGLSDPALDDFLDLYQTAFPLQEQMMVSYFTRKLRNYVPDPNGGGLFSAYIEDKLIGILYYEVVVVQTVPNTGNLCWLYYIAVDVEYRNKGIGTKMYNWLINRASLAGCIFVLIEIEKPEHSPNAHLAVRRRSWYLRNGAHQVNGIRYLQSVEWQPALEMDILLHLLRPVELKTVTSVLEEVLGDAITITESAFLHDDRA